MLPCLFVVLYSVHGDSQSCLRKLFQGCVSVVDFEGHVPGIPGCVPEYGHFDHGWYPGTYPSTADTTKFCTGYLPEYDQYDQVWSPRGYPRVFLPRVLHAGGIYSGQEPRWTREPRIPLCLVTAFACDCYSTFTGDTYTTTP